MRFTTHGFPLPDAGDCAACTFGQSHKSECVGVDFQGERVYYSAMPGINQQVEKTINRWLP